MRNVIVHRRGQQGSSTEQQATVKRLIADYPDDLQLSDAGIREEERELVVSFRLCSHFIEQVEQFLQRFCKAAGFQAKAWE